jgi:hypothetical protein
MQLDGHISHNEHKRWFEHISKKSAPTTLTCSKTQCCFVWEVEELCEVLWHLETKYFSYWKIQKVSVTYEILLCKCFVQVFGAGLWCKCFVRVFCADIWCIFTKKYFYNSHEHKERASVTDDFS